VLAHLGKHATLEEAIEAARAKLEAADTEKLREAQRQRHAWEGQIRSYFGEQIESYHDGQIPSYDEVGDRGHLRLQFLYMGPSELEIPSYEEVEDRTQLRYQFRYLGTSELIEVPDEVEEYRHAFGRVKERQPGDYGGLINRYGSRFDYDGLVMFQSWICSYETWCKRAARLEHVYASRSAQLEKLEAVLIGGD
jgi:hypothetical protein